MSNIINNASYYYRLFQTNWYKKIAKKNGKYIIILGCGRSGTTFSSKWFLQHGLKVGHERLLKDGISSWYLASEKKKVPLGPSFYDLSSLKKTIIHQVREPIATISSMLSTGKPSWEFLAEEIPIVIESDSKVLRAMKYWYYWNIKAEERSDYLVQAERFSRDIIPVLDSEKIEYIKVKNGPSKGSKINTRKHRKLSWDHILQEDEELANKIKSLAVKYGY